MSSPVDVNPFAGPIGKEYDFLQLMCPNAAELARRLGQWLSRWRSGDGPLDGFEIGCGTGVSAAALLSQRPDLRLLAVDSSPAMLAQARQNLADYVSAGRLRLEEADALDALRALPDNSLDVVASNYATHNFDADYRRRATAEVYRVLKPGGVYLNGDRFARDDRAEHLALTQADVRRWFEIFGKLKRYDLLEDWVVHLLGDESPGRIMYFTPALDELRGAGFAPVDVDFRDGVDSLVIARKAG